MLGSLTTWMQHQLNTTGFLPPQVNIWHSTPRNLFPAWPEGLLYISVNTRTDLFPFSTMQWNRIEWKPMSMDCSRTYLAPRRHLHNPSSSSDALCTHCHTGSLPLLFDRARHICACSWLQREGKGSQWPGCKTVLSQPGQLNGSWTWKERWLIFQTNFPSHFPLQPLVHRSDQATWDL